MAGYLVVAVLAAFGVAALVWAVLGLMVSGCREGWILCPGRQRQLQFVYVFLWLRWAGVVTCPLIVADLGLSQEEKDWLTEKGLEVRDCGELPRRLGWERE